jgi:basic membrane protein A
MYKKILSLIMVSVILSALALTGCGQENDANKTKVGMITDSGSIDDKSFNQGTWEGIEKYEKENGTIATKYLRPQGESETDYLSEISNLIDSGYNIIVTPGYKFETAIYKAQEQYPDATFILIDGEPNDGDWSKGAPQYKIADNTVSVFFNEHEAGFLAGVSAALSTKTGKLGFIGGMEIPPVQKYGWGYLAGVKYANDNFGSNAKVEKYIYQGTFKDSVAGQQLASGMYEQGIDIIFHAAGGVGVGVFSEAKTRAKNKEEVYVIGVDVDQYADGEYEEGKSVALTSAVKKIDLAAYNYIDDKLNDKFPGGKKIVLTLADKGVGLPVENPNLSDDVIAKVEEAEKAILDGQITVPSTQEEVDEFLK